MKHIILFTPQHTGTRWMVDFLRRAGMKSIFQVRMGMLYHTQPNVSKTFNRPGPTPIGVVEEQGLTDRTIFFTHLTNYATVDSALPFMYVIPTVITVRDTLRVLITKYNWHYRVGGDSAAGDRVHRPSHVTTSWKDAVDFQIKQWVYLLHIEAFRKQYGVLVHYACVDQMAAALVEDRVDHLKALLAFTNLSFGQHDFVWEEANHWKPVWSHGHTFLHQAYVDRDVKTLEKELGYAWTCLRGLEPGVRPFLESLGYHDLLWWS